MFSSRGKPSLPRLSLHPTAIFLDLQLYSKKDYEWVMTRVSVLHLAVFLKYVYLHFTFSLGLGSEAGVSPT